MELSAFGFRNITPKTRIERRGLKDKVAIEKHRLNQRVGHQARMQQANAPDSSAGLTSCTTDAAGYISNIERFHTDTAGEEYALRQEQIIRKKQTEEFRRNQSFKREEDRYEKMAESKAKDEEHWHKLREEGSRSKKNSSNVSYDLLSLQYHQDIHGEQQQYVDDMVRYRAQVRTKALVETGDTRVNYNIISGTDREPMRDPTPATKPASLVSGNISERLDRRKTNAY